MRDGGRRIALLAAAMLAGCTVVDDLGARRQPSQVPTTSLRDAEMVASHLRTLEAVARATPAAQAELYEEVRSAAATDPTLFNRLRHALVLGLPGHGASDPVAARDAIGLLLSTPEAMLPAEIAIAHVMLHEVNTRIALDESGRREASASVREESERNDTLSRRLQAQNAELARLRQELAEALAKLEAVATLERNLAEGRGNATERPP